jgi:hypothetical protein
VSQRSFGQRDRRGTPAEEICLDPAVPVCVQKRADLKVRADEIPGYPLMAIDLGHDLGIIDMDDDRTGSEPSRRPQGGKDPLKHGLVARRVREGFPDPAEHVPPVVHEEHADGAPPITQDLRHVGV